jgi:DNA invertase Pin-like site-specific DNA recombinase
MPKSQPLAYSYIRFSSAEQAKGDSLRRQEEARDAWLAKAGAVLDTSLTLHDMGVSAYTGKHRQNPDRNALAAFLELVNRGRVPKGSYLVIENLDRLSREHVQPALLLVLNLLQAGVRIVQLKPTEMVFDETSEMMPLMMALMELSRGNSESRMKSDRLAAAWRSKKQAAVERKPQTSLAPAWLRAEGRRVVGKHVQYDHYAIVAEKAEAVRRIFLMAAGGYGTHAISRRLNADGVPPIARAKHWSQGYVSSVLLNRAVVGEFQPHRLVNGKRKPDGEPIPGYFPAVVTEDQWHAARAAVASRRHRGGRKAKEQVNIFAGLLREALTGDTLVIAPRGKRGIYPRLAPSGPMRGLTDAPRVGFRLEVFEGAILRMLKEIDPRELLPPGDAAADRVLTLAGKLAAIEARAEKLKGQIIDGADDVGLDVLRALEQKRAAVAGELATARREASSPLSEAWGECRSLLDVLDSAPDKSEARVRLRSAIRRLVTGIWCVFVVKRNWRYAAVQVWFRGDGHRDYLIAHRRTQVTPGKWLPEQVHVRSFADPGMTGLDLRKTAHAKRLAKVLKTLDPAAMV